MSVLISPTKENLDYYPFTSIATMFTIAYMIFDFSTQTFWLKDFSPLGKQHMCHHILATYIGLSGCIAGQHMPKLFVAALICELSSVFLFIREINGKH